MISVSVKSGGLPSENNFSSSHKQPSPSYALPHLSLFNNVGKPPCPWSLPFGNNQLRWLWKVSYFNSSIASLNKLQLRYHCCASVLVFLDDIHYARFLLVSRSMSEARVANVFMHNIFKHHGTACLDSL
jgi:hypothetical protein